MENNLSTSINEIKVCKNFDDVLESETFIRFIQETSSLYVKSLRLSDPVTVRLANIIGFTFLLHESEESSFSQMEQLMRLIKENLHESIILLKNKEFIDRRRLSLLEYVFEDEEYTDIATKLIGGVRRFAGNRAEISAFFEMFTSSKKPKTEYDFTAFVTYIRKRAMNTNMTEFGKRVSGVLGEGIEERRITEELFNGYKVEKRGSRFLYLKDLGGSLVTEGKIKKTFGCIFDIRNGMVVEKFKTSPDLPMQLESLIPRGEAVVYDNDLNKNVLISLDTGSTLEKYDKIYQVADTDCNMIAAQSGDVLIIFNPTAKTSFPGTELDKTIPETGIPVFLVFNDKETNSYAIYSNKYQKYLIKGIKVIEQEIRLKKDKILPVQTREGKRVISFKHGILKGSFASISDIYEDNDREIIIKGILVGNYIRRKYKVSEMKYQWNETPE